MIRKKNYITSREKEMMIEFHNVPGSWDMVDLQRVLNSWYHTHQYPLLADGQRKPGYAKVWIFEIRLGSIGNSSVFKSI
jgi:hypothetical protein